MYKRQVNTSIPIFTGLEIPHQYALAKLNLKAAIADLDKAKEDIAINIAVSYTHLHAILYYYDLIQNIVSLRSFPFT